MSQLVVLPAADDVAREAARFIADEARQAVQERGRFLLAVSGGKTPWQMLRLLAEDDLPWHAVRIFQVDERFAPAGDRDRNLTHLHEALLGHRPLTKDQIVAMPVEAADLEEGAAEYAAQLAAAAGRPPVLDLVHLGLGDDGHTASLVPGDPVLDVKDRDVAITAPYQGRRRMTLTYPLVNRSRRILWLVTGAAKQAVLRRLLAGDESIPAGRIRSEQAVVLADRAAAGESGAKR